MKRRRIIGGLFVLLLGWGLPGDTAHGQETPPRGVLLISVDGLRPDAIGRAETPVMNELIATGAYQDTALDEMPSSTLPNHCSMLTGWSVFRHGVILNTSLPERIAATTIFDTARAAGIRTGFFASKSKLGYICPQEAADIWLIDADEEALTTAASAALVSGDLRFVFVHLIAPDSAGHAYRWMSEEYLAAVSTADAHIGRLLDALEQAGQRDDFVVIVTADHGGHEGTHGMNIAQDRHIPFIVNGPGVAAGWALCRRRIHIMDATATALQVLGLPTETALDGQPVTEAWSADPTEACALPGEYFCGLCGFLPLAVAGSAILFAAWRSRRH